MCVCVCVCVCYCLLIELQWCNNTENMTLTFDMFGTFLIKSMQEIGVALLCKATAAEI